MKNPLFLSVAIAGILMIASSCTTPRNIYHEDEEYYGTSRVAPHRIWVDDPFYGPVLLERDPFTGRYFQLGTMGMSPYGYGRMYGNGGRVIRNTGRSNVIHRNGNSNNNRVDPQQRERSREEARKRVLGN